MTEGKGQIEIQIQDFIQCAVEGMGDPLVKAAEKPVFPLDPPGVMKAFHRLSAVRRREGKRYL